MISHLSCIPSTPTWFAVSCGSWFGLLLFRGTLCGTIGVGLLRTTASLFTIIGIQKGIDSGLNPGVCVALGTITGCFGGVLRDILLNNIPLIFQKEIYATACIIGGTIYMLLINHVDKDMVEILAVIIVCAIRIVAVKYKLSLPKFYA